MHLCIPTTQQLCTLILSTQLKNWLFQAQNFDTIYYQHHLQYFESQVFWIYLLKIYTFVIAPQTSNLKKQHWVKTGAVQPSTGYDDVQAAWHLVCYSTFSCSCCQSARLLDSKQSIMLKTETSFQHRCIDLINNFRIIFLKQLSSIDFHYKSL